MASACQSKAPEIPKISQARPGEIPGIRDVLLNKTKISNPSERHGTPLWWALHWCLEKGELTSMSIKYTCVLLVSLLLCVATLPAQTVTGSITGDIVDPHGAVMPKVSVKLVSESSGATRQETSDSRGEFTFNAVPPDTYTLTVEHTGFKRYEKRNLVLNPSDHLSAGRIQLQLGEASESVEVMAEGAAVQTASSERSGVITSEQVQDLTVINRDFSVLA